MILHTYATFGHVSGFYPPKSGIKIGCNFPPQFWAEVPPHLQLKFSSPFWASFPSRVKVLLKL